MARDAIGPPDQGNVACECAPTSTASDTGLAPTPWWVSTHLVKRTARGLPHIRAMRVTGCLATAPWPRLQTCAPLRCSRLRPIRVSTSLYTPLTILLRTRMQTPQVIPCSKRMYTHIPFHRSIHRTMRLAWRMTQPCEHPELPRTALCVTQSEGMRLEQDGGMRLSTGLTSRVEQPRNQRSDNGRYMCSDRRIATPCGTHSALWSTTHGEAPLVSGLPRHTCMPTPRGMNSLVGGCMATRSAMHA